MFTRQPVAFLVEAFVETVESTLVESAFKGVEVFLRAERQSQAHGFLDHQIVLGPVSERNDSGKGLPVVKIIFAELLDRFDAGQGNSRRFEKLFEAARDAPGEEVCF